MKKLFIAAAILLAGCATSYQPSGATGGYKETQLDTNLFVVYFSGNGFTTPDRAQDFALLRAAELTLEQGYAYFTIADSKNTTSVSGGGGSVGYYGGFISPAVSRPSTSITIAIHHQRPSQGTVYNAQSVFNSLSAKYFETTSDGKVVEKQPGKKINRKHYPDVPIFCDDLTDEQYAAASHCSNFD